MIKIFFITKDKETLARFTKFSIGGSKIIFAGLRHSIEDFENNRPQLDFDVLLIQGTDDVDELIKMHSFINRLKDIDDKCIKMGYILYIEKSKDEIFEKNAINIGFDQVIFGEWVDETINNKLVGTVFKFVAKGLKTHYKYLLMGGLDFDAVNKELFSVLHKLGIPANLAGYTYIKLACQLSYLFPKLACSQTLKILYPTVALLNDTKPANVTKSIKSAIDHGWLISDVDTIEEIFSYSYSEDYGTPYNSEFIANIAEYLAVKFPNERLKFMRNNYAVYTGFKDLFALMSRLITTKNQYKIYA